VLAAASIVPLVPMAARLLVVVVALAMDHFGTGRRKTERRRSTRATAARRTSGAVVVRHTPQGYVGLRSV
jgi:hypothetical protein